MFGQAWRLLLMSERLEVGCLTLLLSLHLGRSFSSRGSRGISTRSVDSGGSRLGSFRDVGLRIAGDQRGGARALLEALGRPNYAARSAWLESRGNMSCILGFPRPLLVAMRARVVVKGRLGETERTRRARTASLNVELEIVVVEARVWRASSRSRFLVRSSPRASLFDYTGGSRAVEGIQDRVML